MNTWKFWLPPLVSLAFLTVFSTILWVSYSRRKKYEPKTKDHSERIYKDFEFFVKVFMALVAGIGYIRLSHLTDMTAVTRQGMKALGLLGILTMTTLAVFVACHHASKIRRWPEVEWETLPFWQEIWMMLAMFAMASGLWVAAWKW